MIQILNLILLTATELHETRESLRALDTKQSKDLFCVLYKYVVIRFDFSFRVNIEHHAI